MNMKKTWCIAFAALALSAFSLHAEDLSVTPSDVRIVQSTDGGYHLYVRKKADIQSILLTETTKDPAMKADNYAYRAAEYNPVNGDEKRLLDGQFIPPEKKMYSLIDSTPEKNTPIGEAFHIWIPYVIQYGYDWSRHGEVQVLDGTFLNIRAFSKSYADYTGSFRDNPFRLRVTQKTVVKKEPDGTTYMKETVESFAALASSSSGKTLYAKNPDEIMPMIKSVLDPPSGRQLDLVFVIDSTESMKDDIGKLRDIMESSLAEILPGYPSWRIGLVLYKDYFEDFLVKKACPFTGDLKVFRKALGSFSVQGGRDIPEAVYEGLDGALSYDWNPAADKRIILIGDAPPHPKPRGRVTQDLVEKAAGEKGISMNVIILPHGAAE
jgi:hypothetical protein